jgi:hypothetical protein
MGMNPVLQKSMGEYSSVLDWEIDIVTLPTRLEWQEPFSCMQ